MIEAYSIDRLIISTIGRDNSILLSSYFVWNGYIVLYVLLVDSGYTGLAFLDFKFAVRYYIPISKIEKKKLLFLADGVLSL